ncbi:MAG: GHKL domain-containing protein [Lachnospiraceae bacterium]|nr:GHKL domain-containing protein [Lachnospiraceae bacterium]
MKNYIVSLLYVLIEALCSKMFLEAFADVRRKNSKWLNELMFIVYAIGLFILVNILSNHIFLRVFVASAYIVLYAKLYLRITVLKAGILTILFQGVLGVVDYLILVVQVAFFGSMVEMQDSYYMQGTMLIVLGKMFLFVVIIMIRLLLKKESVAHLNDMEWIRFLVFPCFSIFAVCGMVMTSGSLINQTQENVYLSIALGLVGMNIVVFYMIRDISTREMQISEAKIFRLQVENQTRMYRSISENFDKQRKKTHEYKNQIMCIEALIKKRRFEELSEYIDVIQENLREEADAINTNHVIVDAILNTKYQEMLEKNMVFVFKINDLAQISVSDEDIVTILSNLLNNAIEACEQCSGKRIVKLKMVMEDDFLTISVRNTFENQIFMSGEELLTSKKEDVEEHGIGVKNIVETITKYGGSYVIKHDEGEFCFSILIPQ